MREASDRIKELEVELKRKDLILAQYEVDSKRDLRKIVRTIHEYNDLVDRCKDAEAQVDELRDLVDQLVDQLFTFKKASGKVF